MTITNPELRSRTTQDEILLAFSDRLKTHDKLNNETVVISDQAVPEDMPAGGFCVVVAPSEGRYPSELMAGAGHAQFTEDGQIVIGCYVKIRRDRRGRAEAKLVGRKTQDEEAPNAQVRPSLIRWKREILKTLFVGEPTREASAGVPIDTMRQAWEPEKLGVPLLRDQPSPMSVTGVLDVPGFPGWIGWQLRIAVVWDWDLYSDQLVFESQ